MPPRLLSRLFPAVPQCDFDGIDVSRVSIYGEDYDYLKAQEYHSASDDNQSWQDCSQDLYHEMECIGRARAYKHRREMVQAIVESPHNAMFAPTFVPDMIIGCALDLHAYYIYSLSTDSFWVNGYDSEPVVEILISSTESMYPTGVGIQQLMQATRKLFWNTEFDYKFSAAMQALAE